jgi:hypothetical protein
MFFAKRIIVMKPVEIAFAAPQSILPGAQFGDAFQIIVEGQNLSAIEAAKRAVYGAPSWINRLLQLRTILVKPLGLKPGENPAEDKAGPDNIGIFPVLVEEPQHVMLGMNDKHLDFRLLVDVVNEGGGRQIITASTVVKTHNALGRAYLAFVKPFHKVIVPAMMARVSR